MISCICLRVPLLHLLGSICVQLLATSELATQEIITSCVELLELLWGAHMDNYHLWKRLPDPDRSYFLRTKIENVSAIAGGSIYLRVILRAIGESLEFY